MTTATFRFYAELNDFLPDQRRQRSLIFHLHDRPAVKDPIEALGVPHTEVGLVVANGNPVGFGYQVASGDRIAVYPEFNSINPGDAGRLRPQPPEAFILDVHLGRLARRLRLLGIDASYRNDLEDHDIARRGATEQRVVLTRDRKLLCHGVIVHGAWLRETDPERQVVEVLARFSPRLSPFSRCLACNGTLSEPNLADVAMRLPASVREAGVRVSRCGDCDRVYWPGTHHARLQERVRRYLQQIDG